MNTKKITKPLAALVMTCFNVAALSANAQTLASWDAWADGNTAGGLTSDFSTASVTTSITGTAIRDVRADRGSNDGTFGTLAGAVTTTTGALRIAKLGDVNLHIEIGNNLSSAITFDQLHFDGIYTNTSHENYSVTFINVSTGITSAVLGTGSLTTNTNNSSSNYDDVNIDVSSITLNSGDNGYFQITFTGATSNNASSTHIDNVAITATNIPDPVDPGSVATVFQASGIKIGEVSETSAIIWTRCTSVATPNPTSATVPAPGTDGEVRITWTPENGSASSTAWIAVDPAADYTKQIVLSGLVADTHYDITVESRPLSGGVAASIDGSFRTAPLATSTAPITAAVVSCQRLSDASDGTNGHKIYSDLAILGPDWLAHTGDILYYDNSGPGGHGVSQNIADARLRWNRMFAFTWNRNFHFNTPTYYQKDDHDTLMNDCYPGQTYGSLTFAQGVAIHREQVPIGTGNYYRTQRWGKDLQVWFLEVREYRSANTDPDGPNKTILGQAQKDWLISTLAASDATFKVIISPTPIVGPDYAGNTKTDNHSNAGFQTEGNWLRAQLAAVKNCYVVCGDRHWQYASIDLATGLREYGCGSSNLAHSQGGPGEKPAQHSFYAKRGGYLLLRTERIGNRPQINFGWYDIDDPDPQTGLATLAYEETIRDETFADFTYTLDHVSKAVTFNFMTEPGYNYEIEKSSNLKNDSWVSVMTNLPPSQSRAGTLYTQTINYTEDDRLFFRLRRVPLP